MKQLTNKLVKEFWEWCGLELVVVPGDAYAGRREYWQKGGVCILNYPPPIDLNNLFRYAVPKLVKDGYRISIETALADEPWYWWIIEKDENQWKADRKDSALALFWAIWQVKEAK